MRDPDLDLISQAAIAAGDIALKYWKQQPRTWSKPDGGGPVSEADLEIDAYLGTALLGDRPAYGWLSEETEDDPVRLDHDKVFIVDPIDGTRAFVAGETSWAVSIAVADHGEAECGAIYLPVLQHLYVARRGAGAARDGTPIRARTGARLDMADIIASRPNLAAGFWRDPVPSFRRHFRPSLAYRMALVAEGRYDGMITFRPAWEWDVAAGALICAEAGAAPVTRSGAALHFNNPVPQLDGVIAAARPLRDEIRSRMREPPGPA